MLLLLAACGPVADTNDPPTVDAPNKWWQQATDAVKPEKAGTVTPGHTITLPNGKKLSLPKHVQTKKEERGQIQETLWAAHMRSVVTGFRTDGKTVLVLTTLSKADINDAQELRHDLGGSVWASANRRFGLESIKIVGSGGEVLSSRFGLHGNVNQII